MNFKTSKIIKDIDFTVKIKLDQDFSINADIYEANKPKIDKYQIACGCLHKEILEHFPEFKLFVDLHLCDWEGIPTYAVENGFYYLKNGFNNKSLNETDFATKFCKIYNLTIEQFNLLKEAKSEIHYYLILKDSDILQSWKKLANEAIKKLEKLTNGTFGMKNVKSNLHTPSFEKILEDEKFIEELIEKANREIESIKFELDLKKQLFKLGGEKFIEGIIYYSHNETIKFNWRNNNLSEKEISFIKDNLKLPTNIKFI